MLIRRMHQGNARIERTFQRIDQLHARRTMIGGVPPPIVFAAIRLQNWSGSLRLILSWIGCVLEPAIFILTLLVADNVFFSLALGTRRNLILLAVVLYVSSAAFVRAAKLIFRQGTSESKFYALDYWHSIAVFVVGVVLLSLGSTRSVLVAGLILTCCIRSIVRPNTWLVQLAVKSSIVYFFATRLEDLSSVLNWFDSGYSASVSTLIASYRKTAADFSPGILGWNSVLLIFCLLLFARHFVQFWRLALIGGAIVVVAVCSTVVFVSPIFDLWFVVCTTAIWCGALLGTLILINLNRRCVLPTDQVFYNWAFYKPIHRNSFAYRCVLLVLGSTLGASLTNFDTYLQPHVAKIAIHNRGGLDWKRATFKESSGGMFGELPFALERSGYKLKLLDEDDISTDMLLDQQVLLLINSSKTWKADEMAAIHGFVDRGGTLLVLGDHTNVFGLQDSFNQLLDPYGIEFQFDSAYYLRKGWRGCITTSSGIMEGPWEEHLPGIAIGASLKLSKGARSLVTGRYAFSDRGYEENVVGSFLGNYAYDPGERAGELCLVATTTSGRGRVVVFGDTSTFQGGVNVQLEKVILPLMETICRPPGFFERSAGKTLAAVLAIGAMILLVVYPQLSGLSLIAPMFITMVAAQFLMPSQSLKDHVSDDSVLIAKCNVLEIGHSDISLNAIWPLYSLISKSGLRYYDLDRWDHEIVKQARAIAFVAPTKRIEGSQLDELLNYEEAGGIVLVSAGYDHFPAIQALLDRHRLALKNEPIGTATYLPGDTPENRRYPRLYDAWPITSSNETKIEERGDVEILLGYGGEACIVFCPRGQGGLLLISDSRFFSTRNIENFPHFEWEGNVQFVRQLFIEKLKTQPDLIKDYFPSPPQADE